MLASSLVSAPRQIRTKRWTAVAGSATGRGAAGAVDDWLDEELVAWLAAEPPQPARHSTSAPSRSRRTASLITQRERATRVTSVNA